MLWMAFNSFHSFFAEKFNGTSLKQSWNLYYGYSWSESDSYGMWWVNTMNTGAAAILTVSKIRVPYWNKKGQRMEHKRIKENAFTMFPSKYRLIR